MPHHPLRKRTPLRIRRLGPLVSSLCSMGVEGATDRRPVLPDGICTTLPGAWMPWFPALPERGLLASPVLCWDALADVIAIAVRGFVLQGGQAVLRRRCLLMLAAVGLGARHAWRI